MVHLQPHIAVYMSIVLWLTGRLVHHGRPCPNLLSEERVMILAPLTVTRDSYGRMTLVCFKTGRAWRVNFDVTIYTYIHMRFTVLHWDQILRVYFSWCDEIHVHCTCACTCTEALCVNFITFEVLFENLSGLSILENDKNNKAEFNPYIYTFSNIISFWLWNNHF